MASAPRGYPTVLKMEAHSHDRPWGIYSGYFRDPDGHLWEIHYNPRLVRPQEESRRQ
jgi:hypothetical protein